MEYDRANDRANVHDGCDMMVLCLETPATVRGRVRVFDVFVFRRRR
jgi:hypothetical protein